jgi:hypothetical protein
MSNTATDSAANGNPLSRGSLLLSPDLLDTVPAVRIQFAPPPVSGLRHFAARRVSRAELESRAELIYPANPEVPLPAHLGARTSIPGRNPSTRI